MAAVSYKCPNCGGDLQFDPGTQKFKCEYCFSVFSREEVEAANPEKEGEYVLEFEDIDTNNSLELVYSHRTNNLSELKDYKVIDIK